MLNNSLKQVLDRVNSNISMHSFVLSHEQDGLDAAAIAVMARELAANAQILAAIAESVHYDDRLVA